MATPASKVLMVDDGRMVSLRPGTEEDADAIIEHVKAVLRDGAGMCLGPDEFSMTVEREREWIQHHASDPKSLLLVAECDGQIAGTLDFHPLPRRMLGHVGEFGMSLHPQWRGKGLGAMLLEGLLEWASASREIAKLTLSVRADNAAAITLYKKYGFREEGRRIRQIRLPDGSAIDEILMYRMVDGGST